MGSLSDRVLALGFGALFAFGIGWASCTTYGKSHQVKALQAQIHDTDQAIDQAIDASVRVDAGIADDHARIDTIQSAVAARLSKPTYAHPAHDCQPEPESAALVLAGEQRPAGAGSVLDAGTVRLLNAARAGTAPSAAGGRDGKEPPPTRPPN